MTTTKLNLIQTHPHLCNEWDYFNNKPILPTQTTKGCTTKFWWRCLKEPCHAWKASPNTRTSFDSGCPICVNKKICPTDQCNSFLALANDKLLDEWYTELNEENDILPEDFTLGSGQLVWWICSKNPHHVWKAPIKNRTCKALENGCPICANKKICPIDQCNSLGGAFPEIATELVPHNKTSLQYTMYSHTKVWWKCKKVPHHVWKTSIKSRTYNGHGCPICSGNIICPVDHCNSLHDKRPDICKEWDTLKNKSPIMYTVNSAEYVFWICKKDNHHKWSAQISNRVSNKTGCPICSGNIVCPDKCNSLMTLFTDLCNNEWDFHKNETHPHDYTSGSSVRVFWKCNKNHSWITSICNRTGSKKTCCPKCRQSKLEKKFKEWIESKNIIYESEKTFEGCKFTSYLKYDYYFEYQNKKIFVELDGEQHFRDVKFYSNKDKFKERLEKDLIKTWFCVKNTHNKEYHLIRISYKELNKLPQIMDQYLLNVNNLQPFNYTDMNDLYNYHNKNVNRYTAYKNIHSIMYKLYTSIIQQE